MTCVGTKVCSRCKVERHILSFPLVKGSDTELVPICKECLRPTQQRYQKRHKAGYVPFPEERRKGPWRGLKHAKLDSEMALRRQVYMANREKK